MHLSNLYLLYGQHKPWYAIECNKQSHLLRKMICSNNQTQTVNVRPNSYSCSVVMLCIEDHIYTRWNICKELFSNPLMLQDKILKPKKATSISERNVADI